MISTVLALKSNRCIVQVVFDRLHWMCFGPPILLPASTSYEWENNSPNMSCHVMGAMQVLDNCDIEPTHYVTCYT